MLKLLNFELKLNLRHRKLSGVWITQSVNVINSRYVYVYACVCVCVDHLCQKMWEGDANWMKARRARRRNAANKHMWETSSTSAQRLGDRLNFYSPVMCFAPHQSRQAKATVEPTWGRRKSGQQPKKCTNVKSFGLWKSLELNQDAKVGNFYRFYAKWREYEQIKETFTQDVENKIFFSL